MYKKLQFKKRRNEFFKTLFICLIFTALDINNTIASGSLNAMLTQQIVKEKMVTLDLTKQPLNIILTEVQRQTKIDFGFTKDLDPKKMGNFNAVCNNISVEDLLKMLFKGTNYTYRIIAGKILIEVKEQRRTSPQNRVNVSGKVVDNRHRPIVGATVIVLGTNIGAITAKDGTYSINMTPGYKLEASFIGYRSKEEVVTSSQSNLVFMLEHDKMDVDDVVVTGYQVVKKKHNTGSSVTINAEDIMQHGNMDIASMLQGKVAGMVVTNTSSRVGATAKVQIRGQSTILGNQSPIWVVDGIIQDDPIDLNNKTGMIDDLKNIVGNQVSWLNPSDIETITVLKDASATAIYGSRASNGVIVITTKKTRTDKASVNYSGSISIKPKLNYGMFNLMNSKERIQFSEEASSLGLVLGNTPEDSWDKQMNTYEGSEAMYFDGAISKQQFLANRARLESINTDWLDLLTRTSVSQNHNLSVSENRGNTNYRISLGYQDNVGQEVKNDINQTTFASNVGLKLHNKVRINFALNASFSNTRGSASGVSGAKQPLDYALSTSRAIPAFGDDGSPAYYLLENVYVNRTNENPLKFNILNEINETYAKIKKTTIKANFNLYWDITKSIQYEFVGGYSYNNSTNDIFTGEKSWSVARNLRGYDYGAYGAGTLPYQAAVLPIGGVLGSNFVSGDSYNIQNKLNFTKTVNKDHFFNVMLAQELISTKTQNYSNTIWGYVPERGNLLVKPTPPSRLVNGGSGNWQNDFGILDGIYDGMTALQEHTNNFMSIFATFTYAYQNRYVFNGSIRNDFSNRFGQNINKRIDPTYSMGVKYRLAEERFMKNIKWLTMLDFSATYGIQGNALLSRSPDMILTLGSIDHSYKEFYSTIYSLPNKNLSWERTKSWNFSVNTRLFNAINLSVDYYNRKSNAITQFSVPRENGVAKMDINGGMIYNNGIEASVAFSPVTTRDFGLNISINSSKNWNKGGKSTLEDLKISSFIEGDDGVVLKEGYPIGGFWSYSFAGLDPNTGAPLFNHMNVDNDVAIKDPTSILTYTGTTTPYFTGGLNIGARYKNLTLSTSFSALIGGYKRLPSPYSDFGLDGSTIPDPRYNLSKDLNNRWKKPGDEAITKIPGLQKQPNYINVPGQSATYNTMNMWSQSDYMAVDASFFRCSFLQLAYNLDVEKLKSIGLGHISFSASVSNLFVITNKRFNGFDPELGNSVMPKIYSFGVSVNF